VLQTYFTSTANLHQTAEWLELPATSPPRPTAGPPSSVAVDRWSTEQGLANELISNSHQLYILLRDELENTTLTSWGHERG
jgi:hypothetical protein